MRRREFHRRRRRDHALQPDGMFFRRRIGEDAFLQTLGLAHIQNIAGGVHHAINTGHPRKRLHEFQDRFVAFSFLLIHR